MHAVGRIAYRRHIRNVQASWVKLGMDGARQLLGAGVNDLGGTLMDENISRAAGASHGQGLDRTDFEAIVAPLGRTLQQRSTRYLPLTDVETAGAAVPLDHVSARIRVPSVEHQIATAR
jgi:FO synthase